ncbi:MAG: type II toxin-antitoxin system VapC family toxin [Burkholderiales bacterium]|jgi:predicted nucleic acid-binding protein|nr:type II toxin-antitoxin system VapC family toxin [Burkholderiales bacterium]
MIVLDTNVLSEVAKPGLAAAPVKAWIDAQVAETLYLTSVTVAEVLFGLRTMPAGKRREALAQTMDGIIEVFADRILAFDTNAARHYADLAAMAQAAGKGFPAPDSYIAAIAFAYGFTVATRDVAPFKAAGLTVINPWEAGQ